MLSANPVMAMMDDPVYGPVDSHGETTALLHPSRHLAELQRDIAAGRTETEVYEPAAGPAGTAQRDGLPIQVSQGVGVVQLEGIMTRMIQSRRRIAAMEAVEAAVRSAAADEQVSSILLLINSPGGTVDGLAQLADTVAAAAQQKRVVAQIAGIGASAAYYVATQASEIRAERTNLVGSLGARMLIMDLSRLAKNEGVEAIPIDSAPKERPYKSAGAIGTPITERQQADFQRIVDQFAEDFRQAIMTGRQMGREQLDAIFDGRVWQAGEAVSLGLVDQVQSFRNTLAEMSSASSTTADGGGSARQAKAQRRAGYMEREMKRKDAVG